MMKKTQWTDLFREIKRSRGRFLSLLFIVALGTAFYTGVRSSEPDMTASADKYYDSTNFCDVRVLGTLGLTEEDLEKIKEIPGIAQAEAGYQTECFAKTADSLPTISLSSLCKEMNQLTIREGRLPEKEDECFIDTKLRGEYAIGDKVTLVNEKGNAPENLKYDSFTVTGYGTWSMYLSIQRGSASIGDGTVDAFMLVSPEAFDMDCYTIVYATVEGAKELNTYSDAYDDQVTKVTDAIEAIADERCQIRYASVVGDARKEIEDGKQEIADAKKELEDAKQELEDGEKDYADGKKEYEDGLKKYEDGRKKYEDGLKTWENGKKEYDKGKAEFQKGEAKLADAKKELDQGRKEYDAGLKKLEAGKKELADARKQIEEGKPQLTAAEEELTAGQAELDKQKALYEEQLSAYEAGYSAYQEGEKSYEQVLAGLTAMEQILPPDDPQILYLKSTLEASAAELSKNKATLEAAKAQLDQGKAQLDAGQAAIDQGKQELEAKKAELSKAEATIAAGDQEMAKGQKELEDALALLTSGQAEYDKGKAELKKNRSALDKAAKEIADGKKELDDARKELNDAEKELADAKTELEDGRQKLDDGWQEYRDAEAEALPKIADAEKEIADAEEKIADLENPKWYVLDRDKLQNSVEYGMDAERIGAIGKVFPAIFFLVAALVSLTTMTRMIEEERMLIGTMKALGYSKGQVIAKYMIYASLATLLGGILGVVVGSKLLPFVILSAYGMLYNNVNYMLIPLHPGLCLGSIAIAVVCTVGAAVAACYKEMLSTPAALMRPPSPKQGKRVFLEYLPFIWNHLNFSMKSTARNLIRYKKRFFMTVIGIGGCMAVLLVSCGLHDSIAEIVNKQYKVVWNYSAQCGIDEEASFNEKEELLKKLMTELDEVDDGLFVRQISLDASSAQAEKNVYLFTVNDVAAMKNYLLLHNRVSGERYELTDDGAVITEKLANTLGVGVGDSITLKLDDTTYKDVTVTGVAENYLYHYVYISPVLYERLYGKAPEFNSIYLKFADGTVEDRQWKLAEEMLGEDLVNSVSLVLDLQRKVDDMMNALNMVVWVLIISAGLLVFVVTFNLNNINISERRRELASLKVLGFYDSEVAMYVYRENIFLTLFGILAGLFMGTWLHRYTILTLEVDMIMFGRNISLMGYGESILFTIIFSVIVNLGMYYKLKQIDMVESLKSVE